VVWFKPLFCRAAAIVCGHCMCMLRVHTVYTCRPLTYIHAGMHAYIHPTYLNTYLDTAVATNSWRVLTQKLGGQHVCTQPLHPPPAPRPLFPPRSLSLIFRPLPLSLSLTLSLSPARLLFHSVSFCLLSPSHSPDQLVYDYADCLRGDNRSGG
jgi:hypothetical protein